MTFLKVCDRPVVGALPDGCEHRLCAWPVHRSDVLLTLEHRRQLPVRREEKKETRGDRTDVWACGCYNSRYQCLCSRSVLHQPYFLLPGRTSRAVSIFTLCFKCLGFTSLQQLCFVRFKFLKPNVRAVISTLAANWPVY